MMRIAICVLWLGIGLTATLKAGDLDDEQVARDPQNFIIAGAKTIDAEELKLRLAFDIDIQHAGHPRIELDKFLEKVETTLTSGYWMSGFPRALVRARYDIVQNRVIVRVNEGLRYLCADVQVSGLDRQERAALVSHLTKKQPPPGSLPINVVRADGTSITIWESTTGKQVKMLEPLWKVGEPAKFHEQSRAWTEIHISNWFWDRGWKSPQFRTAITTDEDKLTANLEIMVTDPGSVAKIGTIQIEGAKINTPEAIQEFLQISPGMPFRATLENQISRRLWESGRVVSNQIKVSKTRTIERLTESVAVVDVKVLVEEHPKAPPLAEPLEPRDKWLLKLREWIVQWSEGVHDTDLVIDAKAERSVENGAELRHPNAAAFDLFEYSLHGVASSQQGQVLSASVIRNGTPVLEQTMIARDRKVLLASPLAGTHLDIEHGITTQLLPTISFSGELPESVEKLGIGVNLGMNVKWCSSPPPALVQVKAHLDPLAVLLSSRHDLAEVEVLVDAGIVTLRKPGLRIRMDERTGQLLEFEASNDRFLIRCRTQRGEIQQEFDRQEALLAKSTNVYDPSRSMKSLAQYAIDNYRRMVEDVGKSDELQTLRALEKLCQHCSFEAVGTLFEQLLRLWEYDSSPLSFSLPFRKSGGQAAMSPADCDVCGLVAGYALPIYRRLVPRTGWLWPVGRDLVFYVLGRPVASLEQVSQYPELVDSGPLGHLAIALLLTRLNPQMARQFASDSREHAELTDFQADCDQFLNEDSWLVRNLLALLAAVRHLDDDEIRSLVRLLPDQRTHPQITQCLLLLKSNPERPVQEMLTRICPRLWWGHFRFAVESALIQLAAGKPLEWPASLRNAKFRKFTPDD